MIAPEDRKVVVTLTDAICSKVKKSNITGVDKAIISGQMNLLFKVLDRGVDNVFEKSKA